MNSYLNLIRFDKPAGTLLLMWPPLWCLALLSGGLPALGLMAAFALGAFFMRSAGCIINDMTDRKLDAQVERTKMRPLASGALTMRQAYVALGIMLAGALLVAIYLGWPVVMAALPALPLVAAYPWMKRITYWPQLFLGITFNYGVLLASIALTGEIQPAAWWLYVGCVFWTLGYDTIYGFQDIKDDEQIGIKSTSRKFKRYGKLAISIAYFMALLGFAMAGNTADAGEPFAALLFAVSVHFFWQIWRLDIYQPRRCRQLFLSNGTVLGPVMLIGLFLL